MNPRPASRFGSLGTRAFNEWHAIVLTRIDGSIFRYLDPYYPRDHQPFEMAEDDFIQAWQGQIVVSPPLP